MNYEILQVMTTPQRYKGELATSEYLPEVYVIPLFLGGQKLISPHLAEILFQNRMPQLKKSDEDNIFVLGVCFGHRETSDETYGILCVVGNENWN